MQIQITSGQHLNGFECRPIIDADEQTIRTYI